MDYIPTPAAPERQRALPNTPSACPSAGPAPGTATAPIPATWSSWGGYTSSVGSARPATAEARHGRRA